MDDKQFRTVMESLSAAGTQRITDMISGNAEADFYTNLALSLTSEAIAKRHEISSDTVQTAAEARAEIAEIHDFTILLAGDVLNEIDESLDSIANGISQAESIVFSTLVQDDRQNERHFSADQRGNAAAMIQNTQKYGEADLSR